MGVEGEQVGGWLDRRWAVESGGGQQARRSSMPPRHFHQNVQGCTHFSAHLGKCQALHVQVVGAALGAGVGDHDQHRQRGAAAVALAHACGGWVGRGEGWRGMQLVQGGQAGSLRYPLPPACRRASPATPATTAPPLPPPDGVTHRRVNPRTALGSTGRSRAACRRRRIGWRAPERRLRSRGSAPC